MSDNFTYIFKNIDEIRESVNLGVSLEDEINFQNSPSSSIEEISDNNISIDYNNINLNTIQNTTENSILPYCFNNENHLTNKYRLWLLPTGEKNWKMCRICINCSTPFINDENINPDLFYSFLSSNKLISGKWYYTNIKKEHSILRNNDMYNFLCDEDNNFCSMCIEQLFHWHSSVTCCYCKVFDL